MNYSSFGRDLTRIQRFFLMGMILTVTIWLALVGWRTVQVNREFAVEGHYEEILNTAGKQRMWSQRLAKTILLYDAVADDESRRQHTTDVLNVAADWEHSFRILQDLPILISDEAQIGTIESELRQLGELQRSMLIASRCFVRSTAVTCTAEPDVYLTQFLMMEQTFLPRMDSLVQTYEDVFAAQRLLNQRSEIQSALSLGGGLALGSIFVVLAMVRLVEGLRGRLVDAAEEQEMRAEQYQLITERSTDMIAWHHVDGRYHYVSDAAVRIIGYEPSFLEGKEPVSFAHPDDVDQVPTKSWNLGAAPRIFRFRHADGRYVWVEVTGRATQDETGTIDGWVTVWRDVSARVQMAHELEESRTAYQELFDKAPIMYLVVTSGGQGPMIQNCNETFLQKLGYRRDEVIGRPLADFYTAESAYQLNEGGGYQKSLFRPMGRGVERTLLAHNGETIETVLHTVPIRGADGQPIGTRAIYTDITLRKQQEYALESQRRRMRLLYETAISTGQNMAEVDFEIPLRRATKMLGMETGIISRIEQEDYVVVEIHPTSAGLQPGDILPLKETYCDLTLRNEEMLVIHHMGSSPYAGHISYEKFGLESYLGTQIWVGGKRFGTLNFSRAEPRSKPFTADEKEFVELLARWIGIVLTNRQVFQALGNTEANQRVLLNTVNTGYLVLDNTGRITLINPAAEAFTEALWGRPLKAGDMPVALLNSDEQERMTRPFRAGLAGRSTVMERDLILMDGNPHTVRFQYQPVLLEDGRIVGVAMVINDITRQKRMIADLEEAKQTAEQANAAKSRFLANMSHELRTPLNAILGFSQLLVGWNKLTREMRTNYIELIYQSGTHLLGLINDILAIAKIEAGEEQLHKDPLNLHHVLGEMESVFGAMAAQKQLDFILTIDETVPAWITADQRRLRQILINLLNNGIKFTETGTVSLQASFEAGEGNERDRLILVVEDTGVGVSEEEMAQLFQPFKQTTSGRNQVEGTGLGLSISQKFAQMMGGNIVAHSTENKGSQFEVTLMVQPAAPQEVAGEMDGWWHEVVGIHTDLGRSLRILVVDDKQFNRLLITDFLETLGCQVRHAANGREAIDLCAAWLPDLVWMDVRMPVLNGLDAVAEIRRRPEIRDTPIIALTAGAFSEQRSAALTAGFDDYVAKPCSLQDVLQKMQQYLGIRYILEQESDGSLKHPINGPTVNATGRDANDEWLNEIAMLPTAVRRQLSQAARLLDSDTIDKIAAEHKERYPHLARRLRELTYEFEFDVILDGLAHDRDAT